MKKSIILNSVVLAALTLSVGCASSASQEGQAPATNSNKPEELKKDDKKDTKKPDGKTTVEGYACETGASLMFKEGALDIDGNKISLFTGRDKSKKTLCEILADTGKKSAIYQFAGVTCTSCMEEAVKIKEFLATSKGKDVAHILVFTDLFADVIDEDFQNFVDKYASHATIVYDEAKLWKYWSKDPSKPNRATIMAMNLNAEGHVMNEGGEVAPVEKISEIAAELASKIK